jgi:hypothetical protein
MLTWFFARKVEKKKEKKSTQLVSINLHHKCVIRATIQSNARGHKSKDKAQVKVGTTGEK